MGYRETYFKNHKAVFGKYQCCKCGKWFNKEDIDIDHRISRRNGGTDDLWNLQAMCKHCNRSKGSNNSGLETASTLIRATVNGDLDKALSGMAKQKVKDVFGIKYKRK